MATDLLYLFLASSVTALVHAVLSTIAAYQHGVEQRSISTKS